MEEEKKPKRPRIGASAAASANVTPEGTSEAHYDKANHSGENQTVSSQSGQGYQPRPYQPRPYNNRMGGYQQRRPYNSYGDNRQDSYGDRPHYQPRREQSAVDAATGEHAATESAETTQQHSGYTPRPRMNRPQNGYQQRPYNNNRQGGYQQRPYNNNRQNSYKRPMDQNGDGEKLQGGEQQNGGYQQRPYNNNRQSGYQQRPYNNNRQGGYQQRPYGNNNRQQGGYQQRPYNNRQQNGGYGNRQQGGYNQGGYRQQGGQRRPGYQANRPGGFGPQQQRPGMRFTPRPKQIDYVLEDIDVNEPVRLNKFMANSGICSRREADEHITAGLVKVNGEVVTELGTKINRTDVVEYDGKVVTPERKCYVLLNKPKDCVTTSDDPNGRVTVLDLVKGACAERIYPVGRLDRNTTGVLLLTNDGDLASKLTHPKFVKKKIYHVWTDKDIAEEDMQRIADGIELTDGEIHADAISYVNDTDRNQAGIEIHSGRNRIVRRIFESLGYRVVKLDRVYFAGLTKKNLPRGRWRYLTQEEVNYLRMGSFE